MTHRGLNAILRGLEDLVSKDLLINRVIESAGHLLEEDSKLDLTVQASASYILESACKLRVLLEKYCPVHEGLVDLGGMAELDG